MAEARVEAARAAAAMAPADGAKEVVEAVTRVVRLAKAAPAARAARVVAKVAEASKVALAEMVLDTVVVEAKVPATQPTAEMVGLESWLSPMQLLGGKRLPAWSTCRFAAAAVLLLERLCFCFSFNLYSSGYRYRYPVLVPRLPVDTRGSSSSGCKEVPVPVASKQAS